jgi:predicted amidohydrolase
MATTTALSAPSLPTAASSVRRIAVGQMCSTGDKWSNLARVAACAGLARRQGASVLFLPENVGFLGSDAGETMDQAEPPIADADADMSDSTTRNDEAVSRVLRQIIAKCASDDDGGNGSEPHAGTGKGTAIVRCTAIPPPCPSVEGNIMILDGLRTIANESKLWLTGTIHVGGAPPPPSDDPGRTGGRSRVYNTHVVVDDRGRLVADYKKIHLFDVDIPGQVTIQESASTAPGSRIVVCDSPIGTDRPVHAASSLLTSSGINLLSF